jgi:hypothetical protein
MTHDIGVRMDLGARQSDILHILPALRSYPRPSPGTSFAQSEAFPIRRRSASLSPCRLRSENALPSCGNLKLN